jgi:hypothetical protein
VGSAGTASGSGESDCIGYASTAQVLPQPQSAEWTFGARGALNRQLPGRVGVLVPATWLAARSMIARAELAGDRKGSRRLRVGGCAGGAPAVPSHWWGTIGADVVALGLSASTTPSNRPCLDAYPAVQRTEGRWVISL